MPVVSQWANTEKTIIYLLYEKPWDWEAFAAAVAQINTLIDTVSHPVDMIIVIHGGVPLNLSAWRMRGIIRDFHHNIRSTALVGANDFLRQTITAFMRVLGRGNSAFFFAATLEDALTELAKRAAVLRVAV
ncbi:MAG: hypothetical protein ABI947_15735 [Chloroflexota bacterium]